MQRPAQAAVQLFRRIRDFLTRTRLHGAYGDITPHVDALGRTADRIAELAVEQDTRTRRGRAGTQSLHRRQRALRLEYMRPVERAARAMFGDDAALRTAFRIPARLKQPEALVAAAHALANTAAAHQGYFVAAGFPPDFVDRLRAAADGVLEIVDQRAGDVARRCASTAGIEGEVSRGRALMALLDAMVSLRLEDDVELAAEWRSLIRQGRLRRVVEVEVELEVGVQEAPRPEVVREVMRDVGRAA